MAELICLPRSMCLCVTHQHTITARCSGFTASGLQRNEAGLISIDNIQLWVGFSGSRLADVEKVQLWLVKLRG